MDIVTFHKHLKNLVTPTDVIVINHLPYLKKCSLKFISCSALTYYNEIACMSMYLRHFHIIIMKVLNTN